MTQHAHARALNFLTDTIGLERVDAEFVMKRLYDMGFSARTTHAPVHDPPAVATQRAARKADRAQAAAQARAAIEAARARHAAAEEAARAEAAAAEVAEKARRDRELAVQAVLAGL